MLLLRTMDPQRPSTIPSRLRLSTVREISPFVSLTRVRFFPLSPLCVVLADILFIVPFPFSSSTPLLLATIGGGLTPYGGLPPPPAPSFPLLAPGSTVADFATAQRLDIFSFSHMRRYYQHHAAQDEQQTAIASSPASTVGNLELPGSTTTSAGPEGAAPKPLTGIMALRTVGKLAGTVKEQLEVERAREGQVLTEEDEVLRDAQMKSGIGLPLARMFAE